MVLHLTSPRLWQPITLTSIAGIVTRPDRLALDNRFIRLAQTHTHTPRTTGADDEDVPKRSGADGRARRCEDVSTGAGN